MTYVADTVPTLTVDAPSGLIAYRRFGPRGKTPLVLFQRFRGTMDHWDPAFLEVLAGEHDVIVFDNAGIGRSGGVSPDSFTGMARTAVEFLRQLGTDQIDALGWSIGGFVAQMLALDHPGFVRRLLVLGSGPGGQNGSPGPEPRSVEVMVKPENDDEDFLYLFFGLHEDGRRRGLESLRRLDLRLSDGSPQVAPEAIHAQLQAIGAWGQDDASAWERLGELDIPVLVANGAHDVMVHAEHSFRMSQRLRNATTVIYSDAGHGFLFQHPERFGAAVLRFLA
ncbi:alpha/beta hydrolase [Promicromonospora sp. NPDC050249]|uniref:alpha/beta fold hydrolase n=1 Tax=Promicromonospora sp. NPDC050249 TaxID=3154743 RepID=UPI0033CDC541